MTESDPPQASLHPLPPSTEDVSLEQGLQDVSLSPRISGSTSRSGPSPGSSSSSVAPKSPRTIGVEPSATESLRSPRATPPLALSSPGPGRSPSRSPSTRSLTSSRSGTRSPVPKAEPEAGPLRSRSRSPSPSGSSRRSPSPSASATLTSPRAAPLFFGKPALPSSTPVIVTEHGNVDDSAPFESIPLQTTPPHSATLPSSPTLHPASPSRKRRSWNGFGVGKNVERRASHEAGSHPPNGHLEPVDPNSRSSISTLPPSQSQTEPASSTHTPREEAEEVPRLHAPPAHPHPYPLPTPGSPPPITAQHERKPSQSQGQPAALGVKGGSSTFEKVISHTRPSWLPPKDRVEDETHYHQWEEMMAQARKHEEEKRKHDEARRIEREKRLAINTPKWEEMLDEKTFSAEKIIADPALRKIWFEGAPTYLRGKAWSLAIGNPLALSKDTYKSCVARANKAIDSGRFPADILERIEQDLDGTLVHLRLFQQGSPLRADLRELICAWVVYRSDTAMGYAPFITLLGALFLLSSPPATAFLNLVNLLSRPVLRAFYTETKDEIDAFYRVFENLQADMFPKIFANCKNLGLKVPESWFRTLLVEQVPFEAACRLWDQIVLDGDGYIFRAALAIFGFLEPRLYFPDRDEIESILEGRNQATAAILEREKERARLRGETYQEEQDGKLSVFGLNEQALFDWLQSDGWREARFERLVTREMPD